MCMSAPKMPPPPEPPPPPPPPTKTADTVKPAVKRSGATKRRGTGSLTVRRPSLNINSSGSGVNISR